MRESYLQKERRGEAVSESYPKNGRLEGEKATEREQKEVK